MLTTSAYRPNKNLLKQKAYSSIRNPFKSNKLITRGFLLKMYDTSIKIFCLLLDQFEISSQKYALYALASLAYLRGRKFLQVHDDDVRGHSAAFLWNLIFPCSTAKNNIKRVLLHTIGIEILIKLNRTWIILLQTCKRDCVSQKAKNICTLSRSQTHYL
jgi:hypothetical protein